MLTVRFSNPERYIDRIYENVKSLSQVGNKFIILHCDNETSNFDLSIDGPWVVSVCEQLVEQKLEPMIPRTALDAPAGRGNRNDKGYTRSGWRSDRRTLV